MMDAHTSIPDGGFLHRGRLGRRSTEVWTVLCSLLPKDFHTKRVERLPLCLERAVVSCQTNRLAGSLFGWARGGEYSKVGQPPKRKGGAVRLSRYDAKHCGS